jgi:PadR family transcriptional regulator PadR
MLLLSLLAERERYGYELVTALEEGSGGQLSVKDGTIYPVLYRLEKAGQVEPFWETQERGVPRKYYRITPAGREELRRLVDEWTAFASAITHLLERGH